MEDNPFTKMFALIQDSTYIQNIIRGVVLPGPPMPGNEGVQQPASFFGATTGEGAAYAKGSLFNSTQSRSGQDTNPNRVAGQANSSAQPIQSNYMSLNGMNRGTSK